MKIDELVKVHEELCLKGREIMKKKNHDYSKESALGNFMVSEALQAATAENGIIIRMGDKLSRLVSILAKGNQVKDEGVEDTIVDLVNYSVLLMAVIVHKRRLSNDRPMPANTTELGPIFLDKRPCMCGTSLPCEVHKGYPLSRP